MLKILLNKVQKKWNASNAQNRSKRSCKKGKVQLQFLVDEAKMQGDKKKHLETALPLKEMCLHITTDADITHSKLCLKCFPVIPAASTAKNI